MPKKKRDETNKFSEEKKILENYLANKYQNSFDAKVLETKPKEDSFLEISVAEGKLLELLVRLKKPKNILEIGTFRGFSSYFLCRFLNDDKVRLWSIERDERRFAEIEELWKKLKINKTAELLKGDAIPILKKLQKQNKKFDLFFVDASKKYTKEYFNLCYKLANNDAIIIVDNTLWGGDVAKEGVEDATAGYMKEFNDYIFKKYKKDSYIIPAWDGLTIVLVK